MENVAMLATTSLSTRGKRARRRVPALNVGLRTFLGKAVAVVEAGLGLGNAGACIAINIRARIRRAYWLVQARPIITNR